MVTRTWTKRRAHWLPGNQWARCLVKYWALIGWAHHSQSAPIRRDTFSPTLIFCRKLFYVVANQLKVSFENFVFFFTWYYFFIDIFSKSTCLDESTLAKSKKNSQEIFRLRNFERTSKIWPFWHFSEFFYLRWPWISLRLTSLKISRYKYHFAFNSTTFYKSRIFTFHDLEWPLETPVI